MLPTIVSVCLSNGALAMSKKKVIVKRLNSIQNFGAIDVLCADKTGTLTLDRVILERHCDVLQKENEEVLLDAYLIAHFQTGLRNVLDRAVNDATPTAIPRNRRAPISRCSEGEIEQRIEPTTKFTALIRIVLRRPKWLESIPLISVPITAPHSRALTTAPSAPIESLNSSFKKGSAPEMTPTSNPKSRPASAAVKPMK
jgi:hypothetical protein